MSTDALASLERERYITLETYRKDGTGVRTPVWFVHHEDSLGVMTNGKSYKVKRLRRNPAIKVAACNMSGKKLRGPFHEGTGEVAGDSSYEEQVYRLLDEKYGWQMGLTRLLSRFRRGGRDWVVLRLRL